jgi:2-polyprenyl-3-methyl-5-hydroxy-6-metoxy-1,4-benzoquinol methylase
MSTEFWDVRYSDSEYAYGTQPNVYFKSFIDSNSPGKILLPGEGEGRNAIYAAMKGWEVFAVDQSQAGMDKAKKLAEIHNVNINYQIQELSSFEQDVDTYDAIALIFLHLPPQIRVYIHQNLIRLLKPDGLLLIEAFSKAQLGRNTGGPPVLEMLYSENILINDFGDLNILELYELIEEYNEGPYHQGEAAVVRMIARK